MDKLDKWGYLIILGLAASGTGALVNTYDAVADLETTTVSTSPGANVEERLTYRFWVILIVSILALLIGIFLSWWVKNYPGRLFALSGTLAGILGILYALSSKFREATKDIKLTASWVAFAVFVIIGFFYGQGYRKASIE